MEPATQSSTLGEFRIGAILGQGGSGIVYDATWGPRRVALKVLHPSLVGTGRVRAQFLAEAQRLQQVAHPSVVKVLAVGELPDGRPYLAMERLDGETLASVIARGAIPLSSALEMFAELCSAVAALHAQGLVHRDLKPENVFVVDARHAVLLDFGIAKTLDEPASTTTQEGNVRGTPAYMAPERFFGQPAGIATDIYELAVTLYVMLSGRLPWDEVSDPETRLSPRSLLDHVDVPEALDIELRRALSTRAQNRPASATALLEAMQGAAGAATSEPTAASTARLRSAEQATAQPSAGAQPPTETDVLAARARGAGGQLTPLAWAPTQQAEPAPPPPAGRARRWRVAGGLAGVAILAGVVAVLRLRSDERAEPAAAVAVPVDGGGTSRPEPRVAADDPWGDKPRVETQAFALVDDPRTPEQYRAEAAVAVRRLPADTRFVFVTQLTDLRANTQTRELLDKLGAQPKLAALTALIPPCVSSLVGDAEWFVFGAPGLDTSTAGTLIVRGRWQRAEVEGCLAGAVKTVVARDGGTLYRVGDTGWLDFLDDHTAYVSFDSALDAERVHARVTGRPAAPTRAMKMIGELPADRSLAVVADGKARDDWSVLALPKGSDVFGWIRIDEDGATLDLAADPHGKAAADAAIARIKPELDDVFGRASTEAVGKLEVVREGTTVHVRGNLTSFMLGIVTSSLGL